MPDFLDYEPPKTFSIKPYVRRWGLLIMILAVLASIATCPFASRPGGAWLYRVVMFEYLLAAMGFAAFVCTMFE